MRVSIVAAAILMSAALPVLAAGGHCDDDIAAVDKALSTAKLSEPDLAKVREARASAEGFHTAKKYEECEKALDAAQAILGIKDKHAH